RALREIGRVTARNVSDLVKPGTTADVYSVGREEGDRVSALGGGGSLNSAYSAVASVPGAYVPPNQAGYYQTVHIRGGDVDQVGYEFDGIPVNRAFDNYGSGSLSSLGQLELQVYTGASPATAEAQGLAGFINQVIRSGTYPAYRDAQLDLGGPAFYHSAMIEAGGATPSRTFSYYIGLEGFNQDFRYIDQFNGAAYSNEFGPVITTCPSKPSINTLPSCFTNGKPNVGAFVSNGLGAPGGYVLGPTAYGTLVSNDSIRTSVVNLHFGIPRRNGTRDDVQLLYDLDQLFTIFDSSPNDANPTLLKAAGLGLPTYVDSWQYKGAVGGFLPQNYASLVVPYLFPSSPQGRPLNAPIPLNQRDPQENQQAIVKLQYQRNFSAQAFMRLYGYSYYSDYIGTGATSSWQPFTGYDSGDYELNAHTRGISATFADQLSPRHLLELQGSYTTSHSLRMYNTQMFGSADSFAVLVDPSDTSRGICYAVPTNSSGSPLPSGPATPTTCNPGSSLTVGQPATFASLSGIGNTVYHLGGGALPPNASSYTCGGVRCAYYVAENGQYGEYNLVRPNFYGLSLTDQFKPNDRLSINAGLRLDQYGFTGTDTTGGARAFWFNAWNHDTCFDVQNLQLYDKTALPNGVSIPVTSPCSTAGKQFVASTLSNTPSQAFIYNVWQPRLGATYTLSADTVLRASYGKYNEQPSSAYEQYDALQQDLPDLLGPEFYAYGFTTPGHQVRPSVSYNSDFSLERHIRGTDWSFKLSPFYRQTQDQIENFYLNVKAGLISGLNVGRQTSQGFELQINKGDFGRNGFAGQLSFAYTNASVKFDRLPNGTTIVSSINGDIAQYNAYTRFCAGHTGDPRCGTPTNGLRASPCYLAVGGGTSSSFPVYSQVTPVTCGTPGGYANPYRNAPVQPLLDPNAAYLPYSTFPAGIGSGANTFIVPYVATLVLNYKKDRLAITPSFQFAAGNRYGAPETVPGIDPAAGCTRLVGASTAHDPRYPYGAAGGSPYDAYSCAGQLTAIPDPFTGQFDPIGAFRNPAQLLGHLRISYQASPRIELVATLANVINTCFGGQQTRFTYYSSSSLCNWTVVGAGLVNPVGNVYNPRDNVQTFLRYPYQPEFGSYNDNGNSTHQPMSAYLSLRIKL
ncbi:MAG: TonB-dependent receptor, partial [Candidatus Eremiobacteraeota bacterium]|nr:TonB-dependent receptor [Candidatus Eremiobacteraeota bacterium]